MCLKKIDSFISEHHEILALLSCLKNQFVSNLDVNDLYFHSKIKLMSVSKKHTEFYHGSVWKCFILHTIMSKQTFI